MEPHVEAMLKSLVAIAWADGRIDAEESNVVDALLSAFELTPSSQEHIREYAKSPRTLDEIPLTELSAADRRLLLQHAVILTWVDGKQTDKEKALLEHLVSKLHLPADEAGEIVSAATDRAQRLLALL
jgi:tellurite resistance protein